MHFLIHINLYNTDKQKLERKTGYVHKKRPDVGGLVTTTVLDAKIGEVENNIPDANVFVKKTNYNAKISDFDKKYFTTSDYNKYTSEILDAKIKEKGFNEKCSICIFEKSLT